MNSETSKWKTSGSSWSRRLDRVSVLLALVTLVLVELDRVAEVPSGFSALSLRQLARCCLPFGCWISRPRNPWYCWGEGKSHLDRLLVGRLSIRQGRA